MTLLIDFGLPMVNLLGSLKNKALAEGWEEYPEGLFNPRNKQKVRLPKSESVVDGLLPLLDSLRQLKAGAMFTCSKCRGERFLTVKMGHCKGCKTEIKLACCKECLQPLLPLTCCETATFTGKKS